MQISATVKPSVIKFGQNIDMDDPKIDLAGQGHRSKVKVARLKNMIFEFSDRLTWAGSYHMTTYGVKSDVT